MCSFRKRAWGETLASLRLKQQSIKVLLARSLCLQGGMAVSGGVVLDLLQTGVTPDVSESLLDLVRMGWPAGRTPGGG